MISRTGIWLIAIALFSTTCGPPALAEPARSMFCIAIRTVPKFDQDNYVQMSTGTIYATANFSTDLPDEELIPQWRAFIFPQHSAKYQDTPDDTCYPAHDRRSVMSDNPSKTGQIRVLTVAWPPKAAAKPPGS